MQSARLWIVTVTLQLAAGASALGGQQWEGSTGSSGEIHREGRVGIGTSSAIDALEVEGGPVTIDGAGRLGALRFRQNDTMMWTFLTASWIGANDFRLRNETRGRDVMTFGSANNHVGIGTTSPARRLTIDDVSRQIRLTGRGPNGIEFMDLDGSDGLHLLYRTAPDQLRIENGAEDTYVSVQRSNGNVGIGTTSPGERLTVAGAIESTDGGIKFPDGSRQTTTALSMTRREASVTVGPLSCCRTASVACNADEVATGGGFGRADDPALEVFGSEPMANGWRVSMSNYGSATRTLTVHVVCVKMQ